MQIHSLYQLTTITRRGRVHDLTPLHARARKYTRTHASHVAKGDSLPVLLTGAGPLGAVDDLRCYAGGVSQASVEHAVFAHHPAAVRRVPGVIAVGPRQ